jgi:hypothetical protein
MKIKILTLLFFVAVIFSCQKRNYRIIDEQELLKYLDYRINYEYIYNQDYLYISDCKNMNLVNWILLNETGLKIDQKIQVIDTDYARFGGIPLQIEGFPIYYKAKINKSLFEEYKNKLLSSEYSNSWKFYEEFDCLDYVKYNQFELSVCIKKDKIIYGFRNVEGIFP